MWLDGDFADVLFRADYMGGHLWSTKIGSIKHDNMYHLSIVLNDNNVLVDVYGESQHISYEYLIDQTFLAKDILFWEGSAPEDQYGVGIDNINIIPEPNSLLFSIMMGGIILRRKRH
jgi:hypothetical protein